MNPYNYAPPPPIESLPAYMRALISCISTRLKVDPGMVLAALEAGMASAAHGVACVTHPHGGRELLSCFGVVIAGPTMGKTRTYRETHRVHLEEDLRRHASSLVAEQSRNQTSGGRVWRAHDRIRWVALQNATNRGLIEVLEGVGGSTAVVSDEGQNVLSSDLFKRHLDTCNSLYDGSRVMLNRAHGRSMVATDASLVSFVMIQPDRFSSYCQKYGELARGIGFFARTLFTISGPIQPWSTASLEMADGSVERYENKVRDLLTRQHARTQDGNTERQAIKFTSEALGVFASLEQEHLREIPLFYPHMEDAANRALQNVVRLAAILHIFSDESGDIPAATLLSAYSLVKWHLAHFSILFPAAAPTLPLSPQQLAAQRAMQRCMEDRDAIHAIIVELSRVRQSQTVLKSEVQTLFRAHAYDARFRAALLRLKNEGTVIESPGGQTARLSIVPPGNWNHAPMFWAPTQATL